MKLLAQNVELGIGTHFLGAKTSLQATKGNELECTPLGIVATSGKNGTRILIPWPNVRGVKLFAESTEPIEVRAKPGPKPKVA